MFSGFYNVFHTIRYIVEITVKKRWGIRGFIHKTGLWITYAKEPFSNKLVFKAENEELGENRAKMERKQHRKRVKNNLF